MLSRYQIPPLMLFGILLILTTGELSSGTSMYFVAMMDLTIFCIGLTYNLLGGLGSISGIVFIDFALRTIVISQFAKVLFFEPADQNLEAPLLTMSVYLVFYLCVTIGVFVFGRTRLRLPRPMESETRAQTNLLYAISLSLGLLATAALQIFIVKGDVDTEDRATRNFAFGFSSLLIFALVIGVQSRIKNTDGQHSLGLKGFIPWLALTLSGFLMMSRSGVILPSIVYALTCFVGGYRFKAKHYIVATLAVVLLVLFISPFEIYARDTLSDLPFSEKAPQLFHLLVTHPDWKTIGESTEIASQSAEGRANYFSRPGTFVLSRLSLIRADSNLINACSTGVRYGSEGLKADVLMQIPHFLYKNKPTISSYALSGRVSGTNPDEIENSYVTVTAISDSYGAFGWMGVVIAGLFVFPVAFIIIQSIFEINLPWGIVALGVFNTSLPEGTLGVWVAIPIRSSINLLLASYLCGVIVRSIPMKGDRSDRYF